MSNRDPHHYLYYRDSVDLALLALAGLVGYELDKWDHEALHHGLRESSSTGKAEVKYTFQGTCHRVDFELSIPPNSDFFFLRTTSLLPQSARDFEEDVDRGLKMLEAIVERWTATPSNLFLSMSPSALLSLDHIPMAAFALAKIISVEIASHEVDRMLDQARSLANIDESTTYLLEGDYPLQIRLKLDEDFYYWTTVDAPENIQQSIALAMSLMTDVGTWLPRSNSF